MPVMSFTEQLKDQARQLGFVLAGVTRAATPARLHSFHAWLEAGYAGQMHYLFERREAYAHPRHVLDGCRSILMLALPYAPLDPASDSDLPDDSQSDLSGRGKIAKYAQGSSDYHDVIHARLKSLRSWFQTQQPGAAVRGVVDTAPLLERELAAAAGLGWIGKNTLLLNRHWGSTFFLAAILTDCELESDEPTEHSYCGTCTACLDACPTQAFPQPYVLDANRCISYLTIEHRDTLDAAVQEQLHGWVFGCDVCQQVCPWNHHAQRQLESQAIEIEFEPRADLHQFDLVQTLELDDAQFRQLFRHTPLWRAKRRGLLRNTILIAGTRRLAAAQPALNRLCNDAEPLIREAAQWAVRQVRLQMD
jgi:epoxyqueuosine reductase